MWPFCGYCGTSSGDILDLARFRLPRLEGCVVQSRVSFVSLDSPVYLGDFWNCCRILSTARHETRRVCSDDYFIRVVLDHSLLFESRPFKLAAGFSHSFDFWCLHVLVIPSLSEPPEFHVTDRQSDSRTRRFVTTTTSRSFR
jgi:hypothetical protein